MSAVASSERRGIESGLCSITYRKLEANALLELAADAGLDAIEWGSDVHAPPTEPEAARSLAGRCRDAGLRCPSYGTYFFAGRTPAAELGPLCDTAEALGASTLRIWTEFGVESDAPASDRARVTDAVGEAAAYVAGRGLNLALEFHPGTLTHTAASARALLRMLDHERLFTYWQPVAGDSAERSMAELESVLGDLAHVHVFSWDPDPQHRQPLVLLEKMWTDALDAARAPGRFDAARVAYLEYVPDDDPALLEREAAILRRWLTPELA